MQGNRHLVDLETSSSRESLLRQEEGCYYCPEAKIRIETFPASKRLLRESARFGRRSGKEPVKRNGRKVRPYKLDLPRLEGMG